MWMRSLGLLALVGCLADPSAPNESTSAGISQECRDDCDWRYFDCLNVVDLNVYYCESVTCPDQCSGIEDDDERQACTDQCIATECAANRAIESQLCVEQYDACLAGCPDCGREWVQDIDQFDGYTSSPCPYDAWQYFTAGGQEYIHHEVHGEPMDYFGYPICEVYIQRWVLTEVCR